MLTNISVEVSSDKFSTSPTYANLKSLAPLNGKSNSKVNAKSSLSSPTKGEASTAVI